MKANKDGYFDFILYLKRNTTMKKELILFRFLFIFEHLLISNEPFWI